MKTTNISSIRYFIGPVLAVLAAISAIMARADATLDPRTNSWFTTYSARYARISTNDTMLASGVVLTTWSNGSQTQSLPAYCGIQEVDYSSNSVYVRSSGLASYNMGPWQNGAFPNLPVNQKLLYRLPRTNNVPTTKSITGGGQIGIFVDGVEMFNSWDAFTWNGTGDVQGGMGTVGYWNRDAYVNEGPTFDPGYAHQQNTGTYHYHADPIGLRYQLGDNVNFDASTKAYSESTNPPTQHSPILGWVSDGFPIYGPYGYSSASNSASGIRRMISGYVPRNGLNGSDNLSTTGAVRSSLPAWAVRLYGVPAGQSGPTVSTSYPFGRYMEDNDYLGDLINSATGTNYQQGLDFDLDEYNGRWCVTPEFPKGTYAYFSAISSNGTPVFPYNIGRGYYGSPTGSAVTNIAETVTTNFVGGPNLASVLNKPAPGSGTVTLTWSAVEGGTYEVVSTTNLNTWTTNTTSVPAVLDSASYTNTNPGGQLFFKTARIALASYDPDTGSNTNGSGGGVGGVVITMAPSSGSLGASVPFTATISATANPAPPPHTGAPIQSFMVGTNAVSGASYTYNGGSGTVSGTFQLPNAPAATGPQTISIIFSPPMGMPQGPSYTQPNGFTIN